MSVLRRLAFVAAPLAALCLLGGCRPASDPASPETWDNAGFLRHAPADTEGFLSVRRPASLAAALAPAWRPLLADPAARESWLRTPHGRILDVFLEAPPAAPLWTALTEAAQGEDMFLLLGPGTAAQLASLQQVKRLFEAARLRNLFTPLPTGAVDFDIEPAPPTGELPDDLAAAAFTEVIVPLPPAMEEALENFVRDAAIPPLLLGAKLPRGATLPDVLQAWVDGLPEQIPRDRLNIEPHGTFTRARVPVTLLVPTKAAVRARDILAANLGDPYRATYIIRDLLAKTTVLTFGRVHGYFVVSIGTEQGLPAIAADPDASLAAHPQFTRLAPLATREPFALFHADPLIVSLAASPPPVNEYLDAALESALEFAPAARVRPLQKAVASLRRQAVELFHQQVDAATGVLVRDDNTWRAEVLGGSLAPRLATNNATPLLGEEENPALLWTEHWREDYVTRLLRFAEELADFSADWVDALGPVFLDSGAESHLNLLLRLLRTPEDLIDENSAGLAREAFDRRLALAVNLDGTAPGPPFLPEAAARAPLPRLAVAAGLSDRPALARLGENFRAATPNLPPPLETNLPDGGINYGFPVPLAGPDFGLNLTVDDRLVILGTSAPFNAAVATWTAPAAATPSVQSARLLTAPFANFATGWSDALREDPTLAELTAGLLPRDSATLDAAAAVLRTPRIFRYEAAWDGDTLRRVFELSPAP